MRNRFEGGLEINESIEEAPKPEFGRNITVAIEFGRHEDPGKLPTGMSADFLTEKGQEKAGQKGKGIKERVVKAFSSFKLRAQETADLQLQNVDDDVRVLNQELAEFENSSGSWIRKQKPENEFIVRNRRELDTALNFGPIMKEATVWADSEIGSGSKRSKYDLIIQYYLDHPERSSELGTETPEEVAERIAYAAGKELGMSDRLRSGSEVRMLNITHGPNLEPFLQRVLIKDGQTKGFKDLQEIGGALNPGESFEFDVKIDSKGNKVVKILLRGKEYDVDLENIDLLSESYKNKLDKILEKEKEERNKADGNKSTKTS